MIWWCDNGADTWMCLAPTGTSAGLLPLPFHPWWSMGSYKAASLLPSPVFTSHGLRLCDLSMGRCQCTHRGLLSCSRLMLTFDAALHLCLVLLTFPPVPAADTAYTVYKAAAGPPLQPPRLLWSGLWVGHWGCSSSVPSKRGHFLSLFAKRMVLVYPF